MKEIKFHFGTSQLNTLTLNRELARTEEQSKQFLNILFCPPLIWEPIVASDKIRNVYIYRAHVAHDVEDFARLGRTSDVTYVLEKADPDFANKAKDLMSGSVAVLLDDKQISIVNIEEESGE